MPDRLDRSNRWMEVCKLRRKWLWTWLQPDTTQNVNHSGLFCVKGNTPEFQYNYIRIDHTRGQYEFRFFPWPGNDVIKNVIALENNPTSPKVRVCLLNANKATNVGDLAQFSSNGFPEGQRSSHSVSTSTSSVTLTFLIISFPPLLILMYFG